MITKKRFIKTLVIMGAATMLMMPLATDYATAASETKILDAGSTWIVNETTSLIRLMIAQGAAIKAPEGYSLTMTVDGVETGQKLLTTTGVETQIEAGDYSGDIVLTVAQANPVLYQGLTFPLRQALYLDETGIVDARSVQAAVVGRKKTASKIDNIWISSTGECFNGIYVAGGNHTVKNVKIDLAGNGRNDFAGYGAAIVGIGANTRLVVEGANIKTKGTVRTGIIADGGSNVIVKNSVIQTLNGVLPEDYVPSVNTARMRGGVGVGGFKGNVRATNLVGVNTRATYINSYIFSEGWGVLSLDGCTTPRLTVINSKVVTGNDGGYGTYVIGDAIEKFLGCEFKVGTYVSVLRGGSVFYGDSTPESVAQLNADLDLGLTDEELRALPVRHTIVNSDRFGIMCAGGGSVNVGDGTIFNTGETVFLNKGAIAAITVDGARGAQLNPKNGVIMQLMDDDDPGPTMPDGVFSKPYIEPSTAPEKDVSWDVTSASTAATGAFSNIELKGDFYNSIGWGKAATTGIATDEPGSAAGGPDDSTGAPDAAAQGNIPGGAAGGPGGASTGPGGVPGGGRSARNMALTFDKAGITGVISASEAHHPKSTIDVQMDYLLFGEVTNTAHEAINNGVIVLLTNGSNWTVTGTSYLTMLEIAEDAAIKAPDGYSVTMMVDGVETGIRPGTYKGNIVLSVTESQPPVSEE
jgi:hypothetical protein